jgi:cytochrome b involved in lipid metabolism
MSSVPLMASFAEQQPLSTLQPRVQQESEAIRTTSAAAVESDRKGLEDEKEVLITLTAAEISKHNSEKDAWIVVDGVVYDVTEFLGTHPGGVEVIQI